MSRFGHQPARVLLRRRGHSLRQLAEQIGVSEKHFRDSVLGYTRPRPEVVAQLPALVSVPLEKLFTDEVLAKPFDPSKNPWRGIA